MDNDVVKRLVWSGLLAGHRRAGFNCDNEAGGRDLAPRLRGRSAGVSEDPDKAVSEARGAELRENIALTDARRTEEEQAKAEERAEEATQEAEKLSRKARKEREKAERLHAEAEKERGAGSGTRA